ncbi:MAG: hypothetical protein C0591_11565 [Marinilabiliales bacterium]|nr:MAG: hypothetical protein C0591_11565 [Marinilabiliales bacterium]
MIDHRFLKYIFISLILMANPIFSQEMAQTGNIEVTIQDIDLDEVGVLVILLFNSEDSWLEADQYYKIIKVSPSKERQKIIFENIPFGSEYAIEVIHDENGNLKMDMRILPYPKPKEGVGVSNNIFRAGPPEYEKAKFSLDQPTVTLTIQMKY